MRLITWSAVFLLGLCVGTAGTLLVVVSIRPAPMSAAVPAPSQPDISVAVSRKLVTAEAERRLIPVLAAYGLRRPTFTLQSGNAFTVDSSTTLPVLGTDVSVRAEGSIIARNGAIAVQLVRVQYGMLYLPGDQFGDLTAGLNRSLAGAVDSRRFQVQDVATDDRGLTVRLRVTGPLTGK